MKKGTVQNCNAVWPYQEVRRLAVLTVEEMQHFEETLARLAAQEYCDYKSVSVPPLWVCFPKYANMLPSSFPTVSRVSNLRGERAVRQPQRCVHNLHSRQDETVPLLLAVYETVERQSPTLGPLRQ